MHRTNKIVVIIVLILVVSFGIAQFFGPSGLSTIAPASSSSPLSANNGVSPSGSIPDFVGAPATQIVQYEPQQPASSTPTKQGSCWTNSIAAPFRGDAWRCAVGNGISDPCFQIPGSPNLLCNMNPAKPATSSGFVLQLTKPLPKSEPVTGLQPSDQVWLVELHGDTLCSPFTGTLPFTATGDVASFGCAPGALGSDVDIFDINSSSSVWAAKIGTLTASTSSPPTVTGVSIVPITTVWR